MSLEERKSATLKQLESLKGKFEHLYKELEQAITNAKDEQQLGDVSMQIKEIFGNLSEHTSSVTTTKISNEKNNQSADRNFYNKNNPYDLDDLKA